jgi:hypothetical protein
VGSENRISTPVDLESEDDETCDVIYYPSDKELCEPPARYAMFLLLPACSPDLPEVDS